MSGTELELADLEQRLSPIEVHDIRPLVGGASSLSYVGVRNGERVVVKVAPAGVEPVRNRDVLRQAHMISALGSTAVPVPEILWTDEGAPPEVPPLFVMSFVEGTSLEPLFDADGDEAEAVVSERMRNAAVALAALHSVDPRSLGFAAEPVVGIGDEIDRWCRLLETVDQAMVGGWEATAATLRASEPAALPGAVVHGDFRLGNLLSNGPRIDAVIDWEIWSIGDPRVDLGWFLANADPETYRRGSRYATTLPSPEELVEVYAEALGHEIPDARWFQALACFKSTATWSLIVKHNRRRTAPDPEHEAMAASLPRLLERTRHLLG